MKFWGSNPFPNETFSFRNPNRFFTKSWIRLYIVQKCCLLNLWEECTKVGSSRSVSNVGIVCGTEGQHHRPPNSAPYRFLWTNADGAKTSTNLRPLRWPGFPGPRTPQLHTASPLGIVERKLRMPSYPLKRRCFDLKFKQIHFSLRKITTMVGINLRPINRRSTFTRMFTDYDFSIHASPDQHLLRH